MRRYFNTLLVILVLVLVMFGLSAPGALAADKYNDGEWKIGSGGNMAALDDTNTFGVGGNMGAGTTAPVAQLNVVGAGTSSGFALLVEDSAGTDRVAVLDNGNMGVGTTSPGESLEVSGAIVIGNTTGTTAGAMRYNAGTFEGYNGTGWEPLTN